MNLDDLIPTLAAVRRVEEQRVRPFTDTELKAAIVAMNRVLAKDPTIMEDELLELMEVEQAKVMAEWGPLGGNSERARSEFVKPEH
jgi:hypothetical protein